MLNRLSEDYGSGDSTDDAEPPRTIPFFVPREFLTMEPDGSTKVPPQPPREASNDLKERAFPCYLHLWKLEWRTVLQLPATTLFFFTGNISSKTIS